MPDQCVHPARDPLPPHEIREGVCDKISHRSCSECGESICKYCARWGAEELCATASKEKQ